MTVRNLESVVSVAKRDSVDFPMHEYTRIRIETKQGWHEIAVRENGSLEILSQTSLAVVPRSGNVVHVHLTRKA